MSEHKSGWANFLSLKRPKLMQLYNSVLQLFYHVLWANMFNFFKFQIHSSPSRKTMKMTVMARVDGTPFQKGFGMKKRKQEVIKAVALV